MKKSNKLATVVAIAFCAFFFIACGGEENNPPVDDNQPIDDIVLDDTEPTDNEPVDNIQPIDNEIPDDDGLLDNEPTDADNTPIPCTQDEICKEKCKEVILLDGESVVRKPQAAAGTKVTMRLYVNNDDRCANEVSGGLNFTSIGETFPTEWAQDQVSGNFFSFQGIEEKIITLNGSDGSENYPVTIVFELEKTQ